MVEDSAMGDLSVTKAEQDIAASATLELTATIKGHVDRVWCLDWSPCGQIMATSGADKKLMIWAEQGGSFVCQTEVEDGHTRTIRAIAWSPAGDKVATASFDGTCIIWTFNKKNFELEQLCTLQGHENEVKSVAWDPSGNLVATCSRDKSVWVWECIGDEDDDFECVAVLHGHSQDVKMVAWHPSKEVLLSASYDETIKVWQADEDDWACCQTVSGHSNTVWCISTNKEGDRMVSVGSDMAVKFWKDDGSLGSTGAKYVEECSLKGYHSRPVYGADWCKERDMVATCGADDSVMVFSPGEGGSWKVAGCKVGAHVGDVNGVKWRPGSRGRQLASVGDDGTIKLWSAPE